MKKGAGLIFTHQSLLLLVMTVHHFEVSLLHATLRPFGLLGLEQNLHVAVFLFSGKIWINNYFLRVFIHRSTFLDNST
jgi:hypothetical protein